MSVHLVMHVPDILFLVNFLFEFLKLLLKLFPSSFGFQERKLKGYSESVIVDRKSKKKYKKYSDIFTHRCIQDLKFSEEMKENRPRLCFSINDVDYVLLVKT